MRRRLTISGLIMLVLALLTGCTIVSRNVNPKDNYKNFVFQLDDEGHAPTSNQYNYPVGGIDPAKIYVIVHAPAKFKDYEVSIRCDQDNQDVGHDSWYHSNLIDEKEGTVGTSIFYKNLNPCRYRLFWRQPHAVADKARDTHGWVWIVRQ